MFLSIWGFPKPILAKVILPVGISFFTFHKLSYIIDVFRGISKPCINIVNFLLYISFFPQLIAGPIIRFHDVELQLYSRKNSLHDVLSGLLRFSVGLSKKVLIADSVGIVADKVFNLDSTQLTTSWAWFGLICYAYQIYFDFSGYSDMAIGLARVFGFKFLENFDNPYASQTVTEFWRRWHISLSRWMKDYLYIPLGGNRGSAFRSYANLWIVFLISGFWHGASWNFIIWGMIHGTFVVVDKIYYIEKSKKFPRMVNVFFTFFIVLIAWVFFRSENLTAACFYLERMFSFTSYLDLSKMIPRAIIAQNASIFSFFLATAICFLPAVVGPENFRNYLKKNFHFLEKDFIKCVICIILIFLSSVTLSTESYKAFIYFRF